MTYTYDGDNWRTKKSNGELEWHDSFCNHGLITESDLSGNPTEEYVFFDNMRIARRDVSGAVYYYFGDHLNSGRVMTDASGVTQQESDYYPFGYERVITNNVDNRHKFTGKKRDMESSNDYSHLRMYHPDLGRWLSNDPISGDVSDPQSLNRYNYVNNKPLNFVDPIGGFLMSCQPDPFGDPFAPDIFIDGLELPICPTFFPIFPRIRIFILRCNCFRNNPFFINDQCQYDCTCDSPDGPVETSGTFTRKRLERTCNGPLRFCPMTVTAKVPSLQIDSFGIGYPILTGCNIGFPPPAPIFSIAPRSPKTVRPPHERNRRGTPIVTKTR